MATRRNNTKSTEATETTAADLIEQMGTKSAVIRHLNQEGKTRSEIAKFMGIKYQHVRNVLITPLKRTSE